MITHKEVQSDLCPASIQTQSFALRALRKRKPQETQALALASSQSWLPLLRASIPIGWRLRMLRENFKRLRFLRFSFTQRTQRKRLRLNGNRASVYATQKCTDSIWVTWPSRTIRWKYVVSLVTVASSSSSSSSAAAAAARLLCNVCALERLAASANRRRGERSTCCTTGIAIQSETAALARILHSRRTF